jgi:hypothetical protein
MRTYILSVILVFGALAAIAQNAVDGKASPQPAQSNGAIAGSASSTAPPQCDTSDDGDHPIDSTIEARITGLLDSAHLKPGKEVTAQIISEWQFPGCNLAAKSTLYGHVTATSSSRNPDASEMAIVLDHGECDGRSKKALSLTVIGIVAPPDQYVGLHGALPSEVSGGGRDISNSVGNGGVAQDENLNPGGPPRTVHPGIVVGIPKMKLEPHGGPDCSAKLISTNRSVRLGTGSELILTMHPMPEQ